MKTFIVSVLPAVSGKDKTYRVNASTEDDAIQLAFALDGGWGKDRDASQMLPLAKSYAMVVNEETELQQVFRQHAEKAKPLTPRARAARLNRIIETTGAIYWGKHRVERFSTSFGEVLAKLRGEGFLNFRGDLTDVRDGNWKPIPKQLLDATNDAY